MAVGPADGKKTDLVLETGIYNLTQDKAPGLVHFGTAESTPILLVRLKRRNDREGIPRGPFPGGDSCGRAATASGFSPPDRSIATSA